MVHMGIRVDIMQSYPHAQICQCFTQAKHAGLNGAALPETGAILDVYAVGTGVLGDHQQLLHTGNHQPLCLLQYIANTATHQLASHRGNYAETAAMIAALGNLHVGIMAWC